MGRHASNARGTVLLLAAACVKLVAGCWSDCPEDYETGTRLRVTVLEDFDRCHFTFTKGHQYDLVAGGEGWNAATRCTHHWAAKPPVFTTTEWEFGRCEGDPSPMGVGCFVKLPGCTGGNVRFFYSRLPREPGETVQGVLRVIHSAAAPCELESCEVDVPVSIRW
jgi:hypothetical protein